MSLSKPWATSSWLCLGKVGQTGDIQKSFQSLQFCDLVKHKACESDKDNLLSGDARNVEHAEGLWVTRNVGEEMSLLSGGC